MRLADVLAMLLVNEDRDPVLEQALVYQALARALLEGLLAGVRVKGPKGEEPRYVAAYLDLPTGQVRFRLTPHHRGWDGHSRMVRDDRILAYLDSQPEATPPLGETRCE